MALSELGISNPTRDSEANVHGAVLRCASLMANRPDFGIDPGRDARRSHAVKLVLVAQDFPPSRGGIQSYCWELARRWANWEPSFCVIASRQAGSPRFDQSSAVGMRRIAAKGDAFFAAAARELSKLPSDTVSFHSQWPSAASAELLRGTGRTGKVFVAAHGRELLLEPWQASRVAQNAYDRTRARALCNADGVFPVSRYTAGLAQASGVSLYNLHVQPGGVDAQRFCPGGNEHWRRTHGLGGALVFLTVARLVPRKGIDVTLQALALVRERMPHARLVVVGKGPDIGRLRALSSRLGLEAQVLFTRYVGFGELLEWYRSADVFVLPSRSEPPDVDGFPGVFLEAGACGLSAIGSNEGGTADAVLDGQTGLLVPSNDPALLAQVMLQLAASPSLRATFGHNARERAMGEASWDHVARRIWLTMQVLSEPAAAAN